MKAPLVFTLPGFSSLFRNTQPCGQLSEAAARLAKIMHCDPKIDYFCEKTQQQRSSRYPAFSVYLLVLRRCAHMCASMCLAVGVHVSPSLCTLEIRLPQCVMIVAKTQQQQQSLGYLKKKKSTTCIWDDSLRFFPTPSQLTRALLISG